MSETPQTARSVKTTCPYCGVGCGIIATPNKDGSVDIAGDPDHPANFGRLCSKGSALGETLQREGRLLHPEIEGRRSSWDEALDLVANRFSEAIAKHGPDSVAFYVSGQLLTEDYYAANKLMKGFIGSANIDTNSRLCMASSVAGHRRAFGSDTVPGTYEDLERADLIVLTGSNLAWCHPVLYQRIAAAKEARPGMRVVLIDPRRTMTADIADLHLPVRPDGDVALFLGLLAHLERARVFDQDYAGRHVTGLDEAIAAARTISEAELDAQTGLDRGQRAAFYSLFADTQNVVTVYSQGVNQSASGTDKVNAIINCHLATGRIGRPGMGPFSVTGQPNAMGGREVGGLANMLAAHMAIESEADRNLVRRFWRSSVMADKPGLKAVDLFDAVADGRIKALWIMATNPVDSMPDADKVEAALKTCPFVVVSDVVTHTDTVRHADVALPALAWGEKDGTVTNSERRISRQRGFLPAPGDARADWRIVADVAQRMGFTDAFAWDSSAEIFDEHARLSAFENDGRRDFDIGALTDLDEAAYDGLDPVQWPRRRGDNAGPETRFFANGDFYTPDRKARAVAVKLPRRAIADINHPLILNTGRVRDHWHTMTRTGLSPRLSGHLAEPYVEIHPADARRFGIHDAVIVEVGNELGVARLRAFVSPRQQRGSVFVPMHWNDQNAAKARIDVLVRPRTDPMSGQPASKNVPVWIKPLEVARYGFAVSVSEPKRPEAPYWAIARSTSGWRMELALAEPMEDITDTARSMLNVPADAQSVVYEDAASQGARVAFFDDDVLVAACFLSPEPVGVARQLVTTALGTRFDDTQARSAIVAGRAGADRPDPGAIVCACHAVGVNQITEALRSGKAATVDDIGRLLNAGTNCGSCRAEIGELVGDNRLLAAE